MIQGGKNKTIQQRPKQRRLLKWLAISGGLLLVALTSFQLVLTLNCHKLSQRYDSVYNRLQSVVKDNDVVAKLTIDDILLTDKDTLRQFQHDYKQAQRLLENRVVSKCSPVQWTLNLTTSNDDLYNQVEAMVRLADDVGIAGDNLTKSANDKQLSDARTALESTIASAETLSQNRSLSAQVRVDLNYAVVQSKSLLGSTNVANIQSAREQLDKIIDQINQAISSANAELISIENAVRSIATMPDANGSYITNATDILHAAKLTEVWGLDNMRGFCQITDEQASSWLAAFCTATPNQIYISTTIGLDTTNDSYFADAMRHEIAHYMIYRRCGTPDPDSIGSLANAESTASSYAVLYLGANANTLNRAADSRYHMNQASDLAAARIHAGQCTAQ